MPPKAKAKGGGPPGRIKNAKELRKEFIEINNAPDGVDPDPLTVPKCVECSHCGWPVYPRDAKVASKKTYARAGIVRGGGKEEKKEEKEEEAEAEDEGDAASHDSRDTAEKLQDELEELQDKCEVLETRNAELEDDNVMLTEQVTGLKEQLSEAEERIEFMEEAEQRWRDKLGQARLEIQKLLLTLDRANNVSADRETGLCDSIRREDALTAELARVNRRRRLMLDAFDPHLGAKDDVEHVALAFRMWTRQCVKLSRDRKCEHLEMRRKREVLEYKDRIQVEHIRVAGLEDNITRLDGRLKAAAQRFMVRAMSTTQWPWAKSHALSGWVEVHPLVKTENELERTRKALAEFQEQLLVETARADRLQIELDQTIEERDQLRVDLAETKHLLEKCQRELGADAAKQEEARLAQLEKEDAARRAYEELQAKLDQAIQDLIDAKEKMDIELNVMKARLRAAEAAAAGGGDGFGLEDEAMRVVPKGTGVLCVGCLKQLVHRAVKPLEPVEALTEGAGSMERQRRIFFMNELEGMPNPDDFGHEFAHQCRRDPYGISRLTLYPSPDLIAAQPKRVAPGASAAPQAPAWPPSGSPGLPGAGKRTKKLAPLGAEGKTLAGSQSSPALNKSAQSQMFKQSAFR